MKIYLSLIIGGLLVLAYWFYSDGDTSGAVTRLLMAAGAAALAMKK